ncbi:unnamed protein product, partial [Protopolystoma xenopodis]
NKEQISFSGGSAYNPVGREQLVCSDGGTPPRGKESGGRLPEPKQHLKPRMGIEQRGFSEHSGKLGSTRVRPPSLSPQCKSPEVLLEEILPDSSRIRCSTADMVLQTGVCISSIPSNTESSSKAHSGERRSDSDCTKLATQALVSPAPKVVNNSSLATTNEEGLAQPGPYSASEPSSPIPTGLEVERKRLATLGLPREVVDTLLKARKTLRVHASALSALSGSTWSADPTVQRFFKAVLKIRPPVTKSPPAWSLPLVLRSLSTTPFDPLESISTWLLTLKTLFLLAIASACRIGEKGQAAASSTISRWISLCISKAYEIQGKLAPEGLRAHSTRAVSTSWAALADVPTPHICEVASWASARTFVKHYRLDMSSSSNHSFATGAHLAFTTQ